MNGPKKQQHSFAHAFTGTKASNLPELPVVKLWTDGGCCQGHGGWAFIMEYAGKQVMLAGHQQNTTCNEMELRAFTEAIMRLKVPCRIELVSDSTYLVSGLTKWMRQWKNNGWRKVDYKAKKQHGKPRPRKDIAHRPTWEWIWHICERHAVFAKWVKGHRASTPAQHRRCDVMARKAWKGLLAGTLTQLERPEQPDPTVIDRTFDNQ